VSGAFHTPPRSTADPLTQGYVIEGFEGVAEAFERNFVEQREIGAAFAAYVDGTPVVDLWGGVADRRKHVPWREDTLVGVFSGTKGFVAVCLLLLLERGQLALDEPVCRYWPEFGAAGKEGILVRDLVSHRAGLAGLLTPVTVEEATDDQRMARLLAAQAPIWAPEGEPRYHAITFGWLCGELVRRVTGRSIGRFFQEEIAAPLGLEAWIGLPRQHERRVAVLERGEAFPREGTTADVDKSAWSVSSNPPRFSGKELAGNLRRWRAAEIPATNGITTARSLARLYGCLARGGELYGVRLLASETIERGRRCLARGHDPLVGELAFATGFQVQTGKMPFGPPTDAYGHGGAGGSVHGAWPSLRTGFSYTPNLLASVSTTDPRAEALLAALHTAVTGSARLPGPTAAVPRRPQRRAKARADSSLEAEWTPTAEALVAMFEASIDMLYAERS
jgi:CubicO group peptidase (beta-lactamase class C family)